jgi:hypothetical protein
VVISALLLSGAAYAQQCDDFSECTANDMCSAGVCTGAFQAGSCDDGNPCTGGDTCMMDPEFGPTCIGLQPGQLGASCAGGCGTCQPLVPVPGAPLACIGDPGNTGDACDAGFENPCFEAQCQILAPLNSAFCFPLPKECPDTDGDLCNDACDFETGECETGNSVQCDPVCETCNPSTDACAPANVGSACEDFNVCSPQSSCQTIGAPVNRTFCQAGVPTGPTATATVMTGPTPTRTQGMPGECVGDCDDSGSVAINELILGVNISLGSAELSRCSAFDRNDSGGVEINELIGGVNASLNGCV